MKKVEEIVEVDGRRIVLSNLDKPMWKREGVTKADVIQYYSGVADRMVPLIKNRPLMLNRFPHGVPGKSFVQKDWPNHPSWVKIAKVCSHSLNKSVRHVVCNDKATLVWLADMACLEINQFLSSAPRTDWHDLVLVDLDPYPPAEFEDAVEIARAVNSALVEMRLRHMIKTSGADDVDFFQNGLQKTAAAPFTLRPEPGAPASFPLDPKRLNSRFQPSDFNIRTVPGILKREGVPVFDPRPDQLLEPAFAEMGVKL